MQGWFKSREPSSLRRKVSDGRRCREPRLSIREQKPPGRPEGIQRVSVA